MKTRWIIGSRVAVLVGLVAACSTLSRRGPETGIAAHSLRCEYLVDPLGVDVPEPRLSWLVDSSERSQVQTAYRVLMASDAQILAKDSGDLWDSGMVFDSDTTSIEYAGTPLFSHQRCSWKVKVWDRTSRESGWSKPATFTMGMMRPQDWKAEWIGHDRARSEAMSEPKLEGAKWIGSSGEDPLNAPQGKRVYLAELEVPTDFELAKAELVTSADNFLSFNVNGEPVCTIEGDVDGWRVARRADLTTRLHPGINTLRAEVENASPGPTGLIARVIAHSSDGRTFDFMTDESWRSTDQPGESWHSRAIAPQSWPACRVIGEYGCKPWEKLRFAELFLLPPPHLRREFRLDKDVARATLYATALGLSDLFLNGERVHDEFFNPGWTDYEKRVYYRAHDVTSMLLRGDNVLGGVLADGWYSGYIGWGRIRDHYGNKPRLKAQLHVEYQDGTMEDVGTDSSWKASHGPTREADFLMGESYDARAEIEGWDRVGFDDGDWQGAQVGAEIDSLVAWHPGPPVRIVGEHKAVSMTEPAPGVFVFDLGRNFAGVARLRVRGKEGQKITLRFAERLNADGSIYTTNLRGARAVDTYVCRGGGVETWHPRYTFHGFQYVEVTGLESKPDLGSITGLALSSDTPVAGSFECSDPMLNQLYSNVLWTQRANFIDIPTDCPQRDERLGWTGDAQVYVRTATLNADVQAFFTKWLVDLDDGQRADGQFPMVAPVKVAGDDGGPAWADAGVICPWTIYVVYGDQRLLERHYPSMVRFIEFCRSRCTAELLPPREFHCFGDWLNIEAETPREVIYEAYFALCTRILARAAAVLERIEDVRKYEDLFAKIKQAFNQAYVSDDGKVHGDTQTAYVLALKFDLLDGERRARAAERLVADIERRGGHLSTGFIGTKDLMLVLSEIGREDVAFRLLHNDTFPSWGFSIRHGATSIWERWDGWTPDKGFQDPGMNSFAHYSFGAVYQWMVENIGGIRNGGVAYDPIIVAPKIDARLDWARTSYQSIRGNISTFWRREEGGLDFEVQVPCNTKATIVVPAAESATITESGRDIKTHPDLRVVERSNDAVVLEAGSGTYRLKVHRSPGSRPAKAARHSRESGNPGH